MITHVGFNMDGNPQKHKLGPGLTASAVQKPTGIWRGFSFGTAAVTFVVNLSSTSMIHSSYQAKRCAYGNEHCASHHKARIFSRFQHQQHPTNKLSRSPIYNKHIGSCIHIWCEARLIVLCCIQTSPSSPRKARLSKMFRSLALPEAQLGVTVRTTRWPFWSCPMGKNIKSRPRLRWVLHHGPSVVGFRSHLIFRHLYPLEFSLENTVFGAMPEFD